jgi:hypothetical protein
VRFSEKRKHWRTSHCSKSQIYMLQFQISNFVWWWKSINIWDPTTKIGLETGFGKVRFKNPTPREVLHYHPIKKKNIHNKLGASRNYLSNFQWKKWYLVTCGSEDLPKKTCAANTCLGHVIWILSQINFDLSIDKVCLNSVISYSFSVPFIYQLLKSVSTEDSTVPSTISLQLYKWAIVIELRHLEVLKSVHSTFNPSLSCQLHSHSVYSCQECGLRYCN